ncbi:Uncharacterized protein M6B38_224245 [Iris pallida]|uniref:F-box/kelch-repeat protein SKIP25 n=1 Tax=Iris pallida TaxID=29817 RepID=A0AAX6DVK4_IRIPA|nr:Uncharacterized protein M6B38_224245 [Iris pallida]
MLSLSPSPSSSSSSGGAGWEAVCPLKDSRFSREPVEMVWSRWNNKLCMVDRNVKEGAVYDAGSDRWEEMPAGMLSGWDGPAAAEGDSVYVVEESSGVMRRYEWEGDTWRDVVRLEGLKGACAMAAGGGKVVVASRGGGTLTVVDVAAVGRGGGGKYWWEVVIPEGMRVMAMHVLPRMRRRRRTS